MMVNKKNAEIIEERSFTKIIKGIIVSVLLSLALLVILSILLSYTSISENIIVPAVISIISISILLGSMFSALKIKRQGIINGGIVGCVYVIALYLLSSLINQNFSLSLNSAILIITGITAGAIGGVIGVNIKYKK